MSNAHLPTQVVDLFAALKQSIGSSKPDLAIRNDDGAAVYHVNARRTAEGFVVEPGASNPLHDALVRRLGAAESLPESIEAACLAESDPDAAIARLDRADLQWILNRCLRPLEAVRCDVDVAQLEREISERRSAITKEIADHITSSSWWETEVRDA